MKPLDLCEPSPSERRPRIRRSRPPSTALEFPALRSPHGNIVASEATTGDNDDQPRRPVPPNITVEASQSDTSGHSPRGKDGLLLQSDRSPLSSGDKWGNTLLDIRNVLGGGDRRRSSTPGATMPGARVERHPHSSDGDVGIGGGGRARRHRTLLNASQSMPDLPSVIERREERQTRMMRVLRCRKAVRDWIERQWMRRHGKEVERRADEQELMQYKQMFTMLDADGSGNIDVEELQSAMRFIGMKVSAHEVRERIAVVDVSRDGLIDMPEFVQLMAKGTFEGFDVSAKRDHDKHATSSSACDDSIVTTGAPRRFAEREHQRALRGRGRGGGGRTSSAASSATKRNASAKEREPAVADLPFFLWIPAYHRRRTMESLMQGKVVPDLENLSRDSYAPFEHLDNDRAEKVVKEREDALMMLASAVPDIGGRSHRADGGGGLAEVAALPTTGGGGHGAGGGRRRRGGGRHLGYEPPGGLPEPYSKAKPAALVNAETRRLNFGIGFSRSKRPRITDDVRAVPIRVRPTNQPSDRDRDHDLCIPIGGYRCNRRTDRDLCVPIGGSQSSSPNNRDRDLRVPIGGNDARRRRHQRVSKGAPRRRGECLRLDKSALRDGGKLPLGHPFANVRHTRSCVTLE